MAGVKDSLFSGLGTKTVTNAKTTSKQVGEELDSQCAYSFSPKMGVIPDSV